MKNTNDRSLAKNSQNLAATRSLETGRPSGEDTEKRDEMGRGNHAIGLALTVSVAYRIVSVKQIMAVTSKTGTADYVKPTSKLPITPGGSPAVPLPETPSRRASAMAQTDGRQALA